MRYVVLAVGRRRPPFADDVAHYERLLSAHARVEVVELREGDRLERRIPERAHVCRLDAGGRAMSSEVFAGWLEARADAFALRLDGDPAAFIALQRRLDTTNLSDPDPPRLLHVLFGTHPTGVERLGIGEAFARGAGQAGR